MDERSFYTELTTAKAAELNCPHCKTISSYELQWTVRRKKDRLPPHADERDRARFAKAQSYMVLSEDKVMCGNVKCRKRFDISGIKTMAFLSPEMEQQLAAAQPQRSERQDKWKQRPQQQGFKKRGQGKGGGQGQGQGQNQQKRRQQQKKKKRPEVYFPSDYVNYRP